MIRFGFHHRARMESGRGDTKSQISIPFVALGRGAECRPGFRGRIDRAARIFGDVRKKLQMQLARQFGRELNTELHQPGSHMLEDKFHSRAEALDREPLEIARLESERRQLTSPAIRDWLCNRRRSLPNSGRRNIPSSTKPN